LRKTGDVLYVRALAASFTVNTIPEGTLKALAEHGVIEATMPADGGVIGSKCAVLMRASPPL
jgi:transaldolase